MISFDGFRSDYIDWYETPNIDKFVSAGVISEGLIPVFVSKTSGNDWKNDGQPDPLSYFVLDSNNFISQLAQW